MTFPLQKLSKNCNISVMLKAVFLDRDGVLNFDCGYPHRRDQFKLIDGVVDGLRILLNNDFNLFIVSNQSGIGRGYFTEDDVNNFNKILIKSLFNSGVRITDVLYCPHVTNDYCECRKPKPKMILNLMNKYSINCDHCAMIGDKDTDLEAGIRAGISQNIKVISNAPNALIEAARKIVR